MKNTKHWDKETKSVVNKKNEGPKWFCVAWAPNNWKEVTKSFNL
jgi:hypothetical protein